jgi:hypothetical protein
MRIPSRRNASTRKSSSRRGSKPIREQVTLTLLYCIHPNGGLVFALKQDAEEVDRINRALTGSRTWGQFRSRMPRAEYLSIVRGFDENGEQRPRSGDPFSAEEVGGWSDGDYPRWLQPEMEYLLPEELLERFGRYATSILNGGFWMIPPENAKEMIQSLRKLGYRVRSGRRLKFH